MGSPFTDEEKRFLLAEMIKASRLDVETLGRFIWSNGIEPNWMHMQLPLGRNMTQCMQAAEHMDRQQRAWLKRKNPDDYSEPVPKRMALPGNLEPSVVIAGPSSNTPTHVAILPRPASSRPASSPAETSPASVPGPPPSVAPPKKKGRPSRVDRAKLRPILPQQIAPRPLEHSQPSHQGQAPTAPRPVAPSGHSGQDTAANPPASNPPTTGNYSTSYAGPEAGLRGLRTVGSPTDETAHPRVVAEPALEHFEGLRPLIPGPIPLEPEPRATSSMSGGPADELTTLPPLLESDDNLALMGASRVETQTPVANSA